MRVSQVTTRKRVAFFFIISLLVFFSFVVRLGYVQFVQGSGLYSKAQNSWGRNIPYTAKRGEILDRNGLVLATNKSAPSVLVVPKQIKNPATASKKLAAILNMSQRKLYGMMTKKQSIVRVRPEGEKVSNETAQKVRDMRIPGVYIGEDYRRSYPRDRFLAHVLGFVGIDNQGLAGLEQYYNKRLEGTNGHLTFFSDARGKRMPFLSDAYVPPKNGLDLKLTINAKIQAIVGRELNQAEAKYHPDSALAIAVDPNTGEILAMSSRPTFNPNHYKQAPASVYNHDLPIWSTYEPGSTFKIITLAAALQKNVVNLKDNFYDPGYIDVAGTKLHCWKRGGHGSETFLQVVQNSCNPGFVALGKRLGKKTLFSYIHAFGFGKKTGIDLPGESKGILFKPEKIGPLEAATTAFGQGVSVTPIQQVMAVSAAVNGGYLYTPYLAKGWIDPKTGKVISRNSPQLKRRVISEKTSKKIRQVLESVVAKGTGRGAFVDGYRIGGKTGTAQKAKNGRYLQNNYVVSFMGFAPANNPQIVVYVAIDNPKNTIQFGGVVAAPIAGKIISDSLRVMGVKKQPNQMEKDRKWNEKVMVKVPNLVGLTKKELDRAPYSGLKINAQGSGPTVIAQSPQPGTKLKEGSTIRVYLGEQ